MSTRSHTINEVSGEFSDISEAARYLQRKDYVYRRMKFDYLRDTPVADWTFDKPHLKRFTELVKECFVFRTEEKAWEERKAAFYAPAERKLTKHQPVQDAQPKSYPPHKK